jgi:hypothetical protein
MQAPAWTVDPAGSAASSPFSQQANRRIRGRPAALHALQDSLFFGVTPRTQIRQA